MTEEIGLAWWEKVPLALAATAQSTVVAFWYYRYIDLGNWWLNVIIAVVAGLALDAIVVTTIMGRRMGRDSKWSMAASFGAFICSALIAVDSYSAWLAPIRPLLHVSYPLMVFLYSQHLASNMHASARARSVPPAQEAPVVSPYKKQVRYVRRRPKRQRAEAEHYARVRRRTRILENGGSYTEAEWRSLCARFGHRCIRCGYKKKLTADHVIPVVEGGSSNIDNIQPLCQTCNSAKGTRTIDYREKPHKWCKPIIGIVPVMPMTVGTDNPLEVVLDKTCPRCHVPLDAARYGAAQRWGYCLACKTDSETDSVVMTTNGKEH